MHIDFADAPTDREILRQVRDRVRQLDRAATGVLDLIDTGSARELRGELEGLLELLEVSHSSVSRALIRLSSSQRR